MTRIKLTFAVPFGLFILAIGYIAFTLSLDVHHMIGDRQGYDPGSRVMPLAAAIILAGIMVWEMSVASRRFPVAAIKEETQQAPWRLVALNIAVSVLFVAVFRPLGFVLSTACLLYVLTYCNLRHAESNVSAGSAVPGFLFTMVYVVGLYSLTRALIKTCYFLAREYGLTVARSPDLQAAVVAIVLTVVVWGVGRLLPRISSLHGLSALVQMSAGVTMAVYVVFRLLFVVQLPTGLLSW